MLDEEEVQRCFPNLQRADYSNVSSPTDRYNCIAWAAGDDTRWWEPATECGYYWPENCTLNYTVARAVQIFQNLGFVPCGLDTFLENGFEKIAIFHEKEEWMHAARQLPSGAWTSKLGKHQDIEHVSAKALVGGDYGELHVVLKHPKAI